jgi:hypothetical protein
MGRIALADEDSRIDDCDLLCCDNYFLRMGLGLWCREQDLNLHALSGIGSEVRCPIFNLCVCKRNQRVAKSTIPISTRSYPLFGHALAII